MNKSLVLQQNSRSTKTDFRKSIRSYQFWKEIRHSPSSLMENDSLPYGFIRYYYNEPILVLTIYLSDELNCFFSYLFALFWLKFVPLPGAAYLKPILINVFFPLNWLFLLPDRRICIITSLADCKRQVGCYLINIMLYVRMQLNNDW